VEGLLTRILICDDNRDDLKTLSSIIDNFYTGSAENNSIPYSLSQFCDPRDVLAGLEDGDKVDIAILDIIMPGMNGMELASLMRAGGFEGYLIFLSTSNDFAHQSYNVKAFSYILKPANPKAVFDLLVGIEKTRRICDRTGFSLNRKTGLRFISFSELMYVEVKGHQLSFHLIDGEVAGIYATLREYSDKLLSCAQMLKVQRSFIVNLDYVRSCENGAVFMRNGIRISVPKDFSLVKEKWLERMFGKESFENV
jgi:DNA-binding LytR/AlgR family response regulator